MLHIPASWYFDISVVYHKDFIVKFLKIPQYFTLQQYLWNVAIQMAVGCSAYKLMYVVWVLTAREKNNCETGLLPDPWDHWCDHHMMSWFTESINDPACTTTRLTCSNKSSLTAHSVLTAINLRPCSQDIAIVLMYTIFIFMPPSNWAVQGYIAISWQWDTESRFKFANNNKILHKLNHCSGMIPYMSPMA